MKISFSIIARNIRMAAQFIVRAYLRRASFHQGVAVPVHRQRLIYFRSHRHNM